MTLCTSIHIALVGIVNLRNIGHGSFTFVFNIYIIKYIYLFLSVSSKTILKACEMSANSIYKTHHTN